MLACPYDSRQFLWELRNYFEGQLPTPYEQIKRKNFDKGTVVKCQFLCAAAGEKPSACLRGDLPRTRTHIRDLDDPDSEASRLIVLYRGASFREEFGTEPSVYYIKG